MGDVGDKERMGDRERHRLPAWLWGLIWAVVIFAIALAVANALGYGDDPTLEPEAVALTWPS